MASLERHAALASLYTELWHEMSFSACVFTASTTAGLEWPSSTTP